MCSVSLNLTGLDTDAIIQKLMAVEKQPLLKLQSQQTILAKRKQAWDVIKTKMGNVSSRIASLVNPTILNQKTVSSSSPAVASAKATSSAAEGSYDLRVSSLAASQIVTSSVRDSKDAALNITGNVQLNGKALSISSTDSLSSIASKINSTANIGVKASVLQTEPGKYKLILTSASTGTANTMTFGGDTAAWQSLGVLDGSGAANQIQAAADAVFTVNGVQLTRGSNTVSDVIPGVTLTLSQAVDAKTGAGGTTTLKVSNDDQAVVDCVKQFIVDYNTLMDTIKDYNSWNADTRAAGTLFGDPLLQKLLHALREVIFNPVNGAIPGYKSMSSVGISTGALGSRSKDGKLTLDENKLKEALSTNRDAVLALFGAKTVNAALASNGATVTASSTYSSEYAADGVIDGKTSSDLWGSNGGWQDGTAGTFPDSLEIDFGAAKTIDKIILSTLDSSTYPASSYGVKDFNAEYLNTTTSTWENLFSVSGNTSGSVSNSFNAVTTSKIRINVTGSNDGQSSRVLEVEASQKNDGIFAKMRSIVQTYTSADGFLLNRTAQLDKLDKDLSRQIATMQKRLDNRMSVLKKKFTGLEVMLQRLNSQSAWLTQQVQRMSQRNG